MRKNNGLLTFATLVNSTAVIAIGAVVFSSFSFADVFSLLGIIDSNSSGVSGLLNRPVDGKILSSYANADEGSVVTIVEINSALSRIGELTTVSYSYNGITFESDSRQIGDWNVPFTRNSVAVEYEGVIRAGYTVSDINVELDNEARTILVTLPPVEVFSNEITYQDADWEDNTFNHISPDAISNLLEEAKEEELDAAFDNGITENAEESAMSIISDVLAKVSDYEIVFENSEVLPSEDGK